jgi:hypothetical protein
MFGFRCVSIIDVDDVELLWFSVDADRVRLHLMSNVDIGQRVDQAEDLQQPKNDRDHDDGIQDPFDLSIHRDVGVDQPQHNADDNQNENKTDQ